MKTKKKKGSHDTASYSSSSASGLDLLPHDIHAFISPSSRLSWKVHIWVHDAHMSRQCIVPAECLLFCAQMAAHLLLAIVMDRVFVSREIVAAAEGGVARFTGLGIDFLALMWPGCVVPGDIIGRSLCVLRGRGRSRWRRCILRSSTVRFTTMLLKLYRGVETRVAIRSGACVGARRGGCIKRA